MTRDELIKRRQPIINELVVNLNEKYKLSVQYPNTFGHEYEKLVHFAKGFGCKVFRNSKGMHKLVNIEAELQRDLDRSNSK